MKPRKWLAIVLIMVCTAWHMGPARAELTAEDYDLHWADFDGNGLRDVLYLAKDPDHQSGIAVDDGSGKYIPWQSWPRNHLGIEWSPERYNVVTADFNADRRADIFLQATLPGESLLLLTASDSKIVGISQAIASNAFGLGWSADRHQVIAGDFSGSGRAGLLLQAKQPEGRNALLLPDDNGQFTTAPRQTWNNNYLGLKWSSAESIIHAGDFNGDRRVDLLIQAKASFGNAAGKPVYAPNMNGVVLAQSEDPIFALTGLQTWSQEANGIDWSPRNGEIAIGDVNGDGRADVLWHPHDVSKSIAVIRGNSTGAIFSTATTGATEIRGNAKDQDKALAAIRLAGDTAAARAVRADAAPTAQSASAAALATLPVTAVGRTIGDFAVSDTGAATYSIPIVVPPGRAGLQPTLALRYQSGSGNGPVGVGWNITGLSEIERCKKTLVQDNSSDAVQLTSADRFCLDGNKLRLISGTYGADGSTYGTEIETFSRITAYGTAGNGPAYFVVEGKDGLIYEYGNSADSRIEAVNSASPTTPHTWALHKVTDRHGNGMEVRYQEDGAPNGSYRPTDILYGSNNTRVSFVYEVRPTGDTLTGYFGGGLIKETQRLSRIETTYDGELVRRYLLNYETSPNTQRSILRSVQECAGESGNVCLEPTSFGWYAGGKDWSLETLSTSNSTAQMEYAQAIDIDGDGRDDLVYPQSSKWWFMRSTNAGEFGAPTNTNVTASLPSHPINYFGDSRVGLLIKPASSSTWQLLSWNGGNMAVTNTNITVSAQTNAWVGDFDGDALPDFIYSSLSGGIATLHLQRNVGLVAGVAQFSSPQTVYSVSLGSEAMGSFAGNEGNPLSTMIDFNGDGRGDFIFSSTGRYCNIDVCTARTTWWALRSTGTSYVLANTWYCESSASSCPVTPVVGDFNADGLTDVVTMEGSWLWGSGNLWSVRHGTEAGLSAAVAVTLPANFTTGFATDYDSDGRQDLMYTFGANWYVMRSTGTNFEAALETNVPPGDESTLRVMDLDGDGLKDIGYKRANLYRARKHLGGIPDLMFSISAGFENYLAITYAPLTDSTVYSKMYATDIQVPMYVVKRYDINSCALTCYSVTNQYRGAAVNTQGRGFLGFQRRSQTDSRTGITTNWVYRQNFPFIGAVLSSTIVQPNGKKISEINNTHSDLLSDSTPYNDRHFPYVSATRQITYEVNASDPAVDGEAITQVDTSTIVDSYGNPTTVTQTTVDVDTGEAFATTTTSSVRNDIANWCMGFVTEQTVTKSRPGVASQSRTMRYVRDVVTPHSCRLVQEIAHPDGEWTVTTSFGYDEYGNVNRETVSASGSGTRNTTTDYGVNGLMPIIITNAAGEIIRRTNDHRHGVPASETDLNGLRTTWEYDEFGRKKRETRPDGTATTWTLIRCNADSAWCGETLTTSPAYQVREQQLDASGAVIRTSTQNYDRFARLRREDIQTLSGAVSYLHTAYNNLHQVIGQGRPTTDTATGTSYRTAYIYDLAGRVVREFRPISESNNGTQDTTYNYSRSLHTQTDANGKVTTKQLNALGEVVRMTDARGGITRYEYDAFGNLVKTIDPEGNEIVNTYYPVGLKQSSSDPNMGTWTYKYYPTGELKEQTDAKSQIVTFTYDGLSRLRTRTEPEGTTTFTYGTSAAEWNVGKLVSASSPGGYSESYTYDNKGRPLDFTTNVDATSYRVTSSYSATTGLLETVTYPTSTSAVPDSRFKVKYEYAFGLLKRVRDFNTPSLVYWENVATDAAGQTTEELYGNGLRTYSTYDAVTGWLGTRTTGATAEVQYDTYQWDKAGNLTQRRDHNLDLTEDFTYDDVYRLTTSRLNNVANLSLSYTANGNIQSKSDVGTYSYPAQGAGSVRPHAVTSAGSNSYSYDANGNMNVRNGSAITWYSYNLPRRIISSTGDAQFYYGAHGARYKQIAVSGTGNPMPAGTETTIYVGKLYEQVTKPSGAIEYRHHIFAGEEPIAIRVLRSNGANETSYLHKDHLGSVTAITGDSGAITQRLSYDAFGKRRAAANWSGPLSAGDWVSIAGATHRGFTFHEHLDNLDLVHMNGRVYDPSIGRFISADPTIQAPLMSQSLNRYTYAMNNPLSLIDPSGFSWLSKGWKKLTRYVKNVWDGLRRSFNFIVGVALIVVGALYYPPLIDVGLTIMALPVRVGRNSNGYWISVGYGYNPPEQNQQLVIRAPSGPAPPMTAPPGAVSFTAPSSRPDLIQAPGLAMPLLYGFYEASDEFVASTTMVAGPAIGAGIIAGARAYLRYALKAQAKAYKRHAVQIAEVYAAVGAVQSRGRADLAEYLSSEELDNSDRHYRRTLGTAVHRAVADELGRGWRYFPNGAYDYLHVRSRTRIELTTNNPTTWLLHVLRNPNVPVVVYDPDKF